MIPTDSGFWIALGDARDTDHRTAYAAFRRWSPEGWITTWPVTAEVSHILRRRAGLNQVLGFIDRVAQGGLVVFDLPANAAVRMAALMHRYSDLPMDLADASLVVLAEHLGEARILSTDRRDFAIYRWGANHPFTNLL